MFFHNFKYSLKILLKNKTLIFWTFCFPLILGTLFYFSFSDIEKNETLDVFPIAIVDSLENEYTNIFKTAFDELQNKEDRLFDVFHVSFGDAEKLLEEKQIVGYVNLTLPPSIVVLQSGIEETVLKTVVDGILEEISIIETIAEDKIREEGMINLFNIQQEVEDIFQHSDVFFEDTSPKNLSYTMIEFYTLIAMTCLYGGLLTMTSVNKNLANMSGTGKRIHVSRIPKFYSILSSVLASFLIQLVGLIVLFLYTIYILHVDFGNQIFFIFFLSFVGTFSGVSLGCFIASAVKKSENVKVGILLAISMTGSFFAGMMGITMKYIIDKNLPLLNYLNPVNMITDGFYSLYYYGVNAKFYFDLYSLFIFSIAFIFLSVWVLRRQKYDCI